MPQISVDYSERLSAGFDRRGFGLALNRLAVKLIDAKPEGCKVRFRRVDDCVVVGADADSYGLVYVQFEIFPGRSAEAKAELSEAVLAELPAYLTAGAGLPPVQVAVDIRDIDRDCYRGTTVTV